MAVLYKNGIEDVLPNVIDISCTINKSEDIQKRKEVTVWLSAIMSRYCGDYQVIKNWLTGQQGNSWSDAAKTMKSFLISKLREDVNVEQRFYLQNFIKKDLAMAFTHYLSGTLKVEQKCYENSMAIYKAFTAIVLSKVRICYVMPYTATVEVRRGDKNFL